MPTSYVPVSIFVLAPGAFFVLACLTAIQNYIKIQGEKKGKDMSKIQSGCNCDCMSCGDKGCTQRKAELKTEAVSLEAVKNETIKAGEDKAKQEGGAALPSLCSGSSLDQVCGHNLFETTVGGCLICPNPRPHARFLCF